MKKMLTLCTALLMTASFSLQAQSGKQEAPKSPKVTSSGEYATIEYSQPSKNGREIFGKLVPYGEVWRTGANASTDITFTKDVEINGKKVAKGTYALFTIPNPGAWMIMINGVPAQKGATEYEANKGKNVVEFRAAATITDTVVEKLTITPEKEGISISWDKTKVLIPVKVL